MTGVATAIGGSAIIGGIAGDRASSKAADAQKSGSKAARKATKRAADEARADVNRIFPQAQQTARQGFQGALDVFGQSLPAQTNMFTQGNIGAQQAILSGLPQIQNALLGGNVDLSQMQPFQAQQPDLGFFNQQLPENEALTRQLEAQEIERARTIFSVRDAKDFGDLGVREARQARAERKRTGASISPTTPTVSQAKRTRELVIERARADEKAGRLTEYQKGALDNFGQTDTSPQNPLEGAMSLGTFRF